MPTSKRPATHSLTPPVLRVSVHGLPIAYHEAMEIAPERHEVEYVNTKYLKNLSVVFRKFSRNSPLYVSMELESLVGVGNNMTLKMALYEYLAGHYIPTPLNVAYKFCDFFRYEPFFGQMYAKQFPENWTCPFPATAGPLNIGPVEPRVGVYWFYEARADRYAPYARV
ncbi:unnamed protein product [Spodoptera exigua]|nr:unnamed protein product [Spodoptera exigua]